MKLKKCILIQLLLLLFSTRVVLDASNAMEFTKSFGFIKSDAAANYNYQREGFILSTIWIHITASANPLIFTDFYSA